MRISLRLSSNMSAEQALGTATVAREGGIGRLWLADNPLERSSPVMAGAIAAREPDLDLGLGVLSARERHPVVIAQEAAVLQEIARGQVSVGLGVGNDASRRQLGLPRRGGLGLLRETIDVVRTLSAGGSVPAFDPELDDHFALKVETRPLPMLIGAIGPKTIALAGEIADGLILSMGSTVEASRSASDIARSAHAGSDRRDGFEVIAYAAFGGLGADNPDAAAAVAGHLLSAVAAVPSFAALIEGTGVDAEAAGRIAAAGAPPAELVEAMTIAGPVERCLDRVRAYRDAGVDELALALGGWNGDFDAALADAAALATAWDAAEREERG